MESVPPATVKPILPDIIPAWQTAARELGIRVATQKSLTHIDGTTVVFPIHLPDFGRGYGSLLWPAKGLEALDKIEETVHRWGFSYAVINPDFYCSFDRTMFTSFLCRLGFRHGVAQRPTWYRDDDL
jgi:hypothetical protein